MAVIRALVFYTSKGIKVFWKPSEFCPRAFLFSPTVYLREEYEKKRYLMKTIRLIMVFVREQSVLIWIRFWYNLSIKILRTGKEYETTGFNLYRGEWLVYSAFIRLRNKCLFLRVIGRNKRIEQRRNGKQSFLSFVRRSVNENTLSVKGKIHCLRQPLTERQHTDR